MTDEIIKGLENVRYHLPASSHKAAIDVAIDYINKQQAEIDRCHKEFEELNIIEEEERKEALENARKSVGIRDGADAGKQAVKWFVTRIVELNKQLADVENQLNQKCMTMQQLKKIIKKM